jgi:predicted  nucleic acid-binding Zn-ribbon protein
MASTRLERAQRVLQLLEWREVQAQQKIAALEARKTVLEQDHRALMAAFCADHQLSARFLEAFNRRIVSLEHSLAAVRHEIDLCISELRQQRRAVNVAERWLDAARQHTSKAVERNQMYDMIDRVVLNYAASSRQACQYSLVIRSNRNEQT